MTTENFLYDSIGPYLPKDPNAVLDYRFNWIEWLNGDTIAGAPTITVVNGIKDSQSNTDTSVTVWVSGGLAGQVISITCHIVTAAGRQDDRTIRLKVKNR